MPEKTDVDISVEFDNVLGWTADNFMIVNVDKTKEIVFHRPSAPSSLHPAMTGIEQMVSVNLLGVSFSNNLIIMFHFLRICSCTVHYSKVNFTRII